MRPSERDGQPDRERRLERRATRARPPGHARSPRPGGCPARRRAAPPRDSAISAAPDRAGCCASGSSVKPLSQQLPARARARSAAAARRRGGCARGAGAPPAPPRSPAGAIRAALRAAALSSACSRPFSSAIAAAASTPSSSCGSSASAGSWNSAATALPVPVDHACWLGPRRVRAARSAGHPRRPSWPNSGSQYASVSDGSRRASASASRRSAGAGLARSCVSRSPRVECARGAR